MKVYEFYRVPFIERESFTHRNMKCKDTRSYDIYERGDRMCLSEESPFLFVGHICL